MIAALLGTTALTAPTRAEAGPVVPFIAGLFGVTGTVAFVTSAAYVAGATFAASAIGSFVLRTVLSVGLSLLAQALAPKPSVPPPAARMVNFAQPISYAEWVFGRTRKGGPLGFTGFADLRRYYVPILAAHSIHSIVEHWLDEVTVDVDDTITDQTLSNIKAPAQAAGFGRIDAFLGQSGQTADAGLIGAFSEMTPAHDFAGLAGGVIWAKRPPQSKFSDIYPRGREWAWTPVIDGNDQIYDPRDKTRKYTNNAALVLAYWITEILGRDVVWDDVAVEADACDVLVTNAQSETQPRWTLNGTISDDLEFEDQRAQLAAACDAFLYERADGKVGFNVGRWIEPTVTLTEDDFLSLEFSEGDWGANAPTETSVAYVEPENGWRETPSGVWVDDVSSRPIRQEPQLYMVTNHNQASRMNRRLSRTSRAQYRLNGTLGVIGYDLLGQRFVRVVHSELGIDAYFEVGELVREGIGVFQLSANSVRPEDFNDEIVEPKRPEFKRIITSDDVPFVTGFGATVKKGGVIRFVWDAQDVSMTQQILLTTADGQFRQIIDVPGGGETSHTVTGLVNGESYLAQIRNLTATTRGSQWAPIPALDVTAKSNTVAPEALTEFSVSPPSVVTNSPLTVAFKAANDPNHSAIEIWRGTSSDFGSAVLIKTVYTTPNASGTYTTYAPSAGTFYYWARPINVSAVPGPESGPETITASEPGP